MLIIGVFIGLWVVLFAAFMAFYSKKKKNNASFVSENSNGYSSSALQED